MEKKLYQVTAPLRLVTLPILPNLMLSEINNSSGVDDANPMFRQSHSPKKYLAFSLNSF